MPYEALVTEKKIVPEGKAIFEENVTTVSIDDLGEGEFVVIKQMDEHNKMNQIGINPGEEWDLLKVVIDEMIRSCRG